MYKTGLIVGKFCPLHKGHEHLISTAQSQCQQLYILSYTEPEFAGCEPEKRMRWLAQSAPGATCLVLSADHKVPPNNAGDDIHRAFTARICQEEFKIGPDAVFTSEAYGDDFAAFLSKEFRKPVAHICVDQPRRHVPMSATQIREDVHESREYLPSHVYADFVESVCFLGAESTGKSSLSSHLSRLYATAHVEEYGRTLWIEKDGRLAADDYVKIAKTHTDMEDAAKLRAHRHVFIDTSPLTTLFYALEYVGEAAAELRAFSHRKYDHIFLCHPDFPMVQDGWRSDENFRRRQHDWYVDILTARGVTYTDLLGSFDDKIERVRRQLGLPHVPS